MNYIAVVDDEADIREILEIQLTKKKFRVKTFKDGETFLNSLSAEVPELVILDIMMDNVNGYEVLSSLKRNYPDTSVIFLSAKSQPLDKVLGLDMGADDYLSKPFQREEMIARVNAVLRRTKSSTNKKPRSSNLYFYKNLQFDPDKKTLIIDGEMIKTTKTEFSMMKLLCSTPQKVFTRDEIMESVWDDVIVSERAIDVHIRRLRKKLGSYENIIKTHPAMGYAIEAGE